MIMDIKKTGVTSTAVVVSKRVEVRSYGNGIASDACCARGMKSVPSVAYFAAFSLEDGSSEEMEVPMGVYLRVNPGDRGLLTLRRGVFEKLWE